MKRSAILAGAVAAALGATLGTAACSGDDNGGSTADAAPDISAQPAYGIPIDAAPHPDVISAGDAYGIPDVLAADAAYGIPFPFDAPEDVVTAGDAYGIPLDAGGADANGD